MAMIYVRSRPGRTSYYEGRRIPEDKFVPVADIPYTRRLIHHWEDVEVQSAEPPPAPSRSQGPASRQTSPRPESPVSSAPAKE